MNVEWEIPKRLQHCSDSQWWRPLRDEQSIGFECAAFAFYHQRPIVVEHHAAIGEANVPLFAVHLFRPGQDQFLGKWDVMLARRNLVGKVSVTSEDTRVAALAGILAHEVADVRVGDRLHCASQGLALLVVGADQDLGGAQLVGHYLEGYVNLPLSEGLLGSALGDRHVHRQAVLVIQGPGFEGQADLF